MLPLRPLTVGDILDTAFRALRATFATVAVLVLLVHGPYQLVSSLALAQLLPELEDPFAAMAPDDPAAAIDLLVRLGSLAGVLGLIEVVVSLFVSLAVVWVVLRTDRSQPTSVGAALSEAVRRAGATLGALLLVLFFGLVVAFPAGLVLVIALAVVPPLGVLMALPTVPAFVLVWLALTYLLAPISVVERQGPWAIFTRALWVVRRRFWRTIGVTTLMLLLVLVLTASVGIAFGWLALLGGPAGWVVEGIGGAVVSLVSVPLTAFAALLVYVDARVRLEGYDLELRARGLGPA